MDIGSIAYDYAHREGIGTSDAVVEWLISVGEDTAEQFDYADGAVSEDSLHEIADSGVPIYTAERMEIMAASNTLAATTPDAGAGATAEETAGIVLYEHAYTFAWKVLRELEDAAEDE